MIPCDPVGYLNNEYGAKNWEKPEPIKYKWTSLHYKDTWSDEDWPNVVRYYDKNGKVLESKILNYINKHLDKDKQIKSIPNLSNED
jgi:hypothetical protein